MHDQGMFRHGPPAHTLEEPTRLGAQEHGRDPGGGTGALALPPVDRCPNRAHQEVCESTGLEDTPRGMPEFCVSMTLEETTAGVEVGVELRLETERRRRRQD